MRKLIILTISVLIILSLSLFAQKLTQKPVPEKDYDYNSMLQRVKLSDTTVKFFDFRFAYTLTNKYDPFGSTFELMRARMFESMRSNDFLNASLKADSILSENYVDMDAHFVCSVAYDALKDSAKSKYHSWVLNQLLYSVLESGDGETPQTAYFVISELEEYFTLYALGLEPKGQSVINNDGVGIDILSVVNPKNQDTLEIYFNRDVAWKRLSNELKDKEDTKSPDQK